MILEKPAEERRRDPRLISNVPIKIVQEDGDIVTETGNISRSGAYCRVQNPIAPMTKLKINLLMPIEQGGKETSKKISCEGVVVRVEENSQGKGYNIAIFFNDMNQRDAEHITEYINTHQDKA